MRKGMRAGWLGLLFLFGCGDDTGVTTIEGTLQGVQESVILAQSPPPTITVLGRGDQEFETTFDVTTLGDNQASFVIRDVPEDQELVFEVVGPNLDSIISFATNTASDRFRLPALLAGSRSAFVDLAEDTDGPNIMVDPALGMVSGILSASFGSSPVSSNSANRVALVSKQNNSEATDFGPYYFVGDALVEGGGCPNDICAYIFFNVPEGVYRFQTLDAANAVIAQRDVVVLASRLSFGIE
jgi:hypothetical protein